jgi:hypothetical protein
MKYIITNATSKENLNGGWRIVIDEQVAYINNLSIKFSKKGRLKLVFRQQFPWQEGVIKGIKLSLKLDKLHSQELMECLNQGDTKISINEGCYVEVFISKDLQYVFSNFVKTLSRYEHPRQLLASPIASKQCNILMDEYQSLKILEQLSSEIKSKQISLTRNNKPLVICDIDQSPERQHTSKAIDPSQVSWNKSQFQRKILQNFLNS